VRLSYGLIGLTLLAACGSWDPAVTGGPGTTDLGGFGPSVTGELSVPQDLVDFGEVPAASPATEYVTLVNVGDGALAIEDLGLDGDEEFAFADEASLPTSIPAGGQVTVGVVFEAFDDDEHDATLSVRSDDRQAGVVDVQLLAQSLAPSALFTPALHVFQDVPIGCEDEVDFTIINLGNLELTVTELSLQTVFGAGVAAELPTTPLVVRPGEGNQVTFPVTYAPTDYTPGQFRLVMISDDLDLPEQEATVNASAGDPPSGGDPVQDDWTLTVDQTTFLLSEVPQEGSIVVTVDGFPRASGWTYERHPAPAVVFSGATAPTAGSAVAIAYESELDCD
jgi:hypothetical protein